MEDSSRSNSSSTSSSFLRPHLPGVKKGVSSFFGMNSSRRSSSSSSDNAVPQPALPRRVTSVQCSIVTGEGNDVVGRLQDEFDDFDYDGSDPHALYPTQEDVLTKEEEDESESDPLADFWNDRVKTFTKNMDTIGAMISGQMEDFEDPNNNNNGNGNHTRRR